MPSSYSRQAYFCELKFPAVETIEILNGKSNFHQWHSEIRPILLSNPLSSDLILGTWTEPQSPPSWDPEDQASFHEERREWHGANTASCRFIRATLAMNVSPFVRQYTTAKTLFFNLVWLYGEDAGIDSQGGPPVPANAETLNAKKGRASLLAALEAKRTLDYLQPVCGTLKLSASTFPPYRTNNGNNEVTSISSSATEAPTSCNKLLKLQPTITPEPAQAPEQHVPLVRLFKRARVSPDANLETIHEHDEPHPGRRVPSGCAIDFDYGLSRGDPVHEYDDDEVCLLPAQQMTSPSLVLSISRTADSGDQDQDECHLEDIDAAESASQPKKRQVSSPDLELRLAKTSITSILKTVTAKNKARKQDRFSFSFPLRRLSTEREKSTGEGKGKGKARA
ncbi:uncharacterized protein Z519_03167 [Cladophialophora bantiana CBS 173.52]|uniref:Uncharacterized protein n=1 Tax=Cladophialophora bantiana (strain ATCC 10958 / CBS 173.52 / CDC B-1940 / NIH 8579) TaxID=1442370 RepID=A0A0D2HYW7_CLAB1|nr:uncharacterized protein Z519_03167 [Cladophialophora bantiana CBS 173.52]KIW96100.1 hypothetical protein Z519_03167 [Cladophialophora bantiana CBS 173.52]